MAEKPKVPAVCEDVGAGRDNVLVTGIKNGQLQIICRETGGRALTLVQASVDWWGKHFFPTKEKPAVFAEVLKSYAMECGAEPEALDQLKDFVNITKEEYSKMVATTAAGGKKPAAKKAPAEKPAAEEKPKAAPKAAAPKKAPAEKPAAAPKAAKPAAEKPAKAAPAKKPAQTPEEREAANKERLAKLNAEKKAKKEAAGPKEPRKTVSGEIQRLLLEGKLNDEQIFKQIQKDFGLSDDKKSYVGWNRSKLIKDGKLKKAK